MRISILTVFPELYDSFINTSLVARAVEKGKIEFNLIKFSDMCATKERIDESTVGHGVGMILKPDVVAKAIDEAEGKWGKAFKIFFSPKGTKLTQPILRKLYSKIDDASKEASQFDDKHLILVCCRYEGQDARVIEHYADEVVSIGDYVLMGGDLPAQVLLEGLLRLVPGIVGKEQSVLEDSFSGGLLDYPQYGLPVEWEGKKIPDVLRSGDHAAIAKWREEAAAKDTVLNRFDWLRSRGSKEEVEAGSKFIPNHYTVLMHTDILIKGGRIGNTSITSLDIHDVARSGVTYGVKNSFITSALEDQIKIMKTFLGFWLSDDGKKYNKNRYQAVSRVVPTSSLDEVLEKVREQEGVDPILIATSAKPYKNLEAIDYYSQGKIWAQGRPVVFIFGTGQGLADKVLDKCDYILASIDGMTEYNHLSVRSAVGIILDRWLGMNKRS